MGNLKTLKAMNDKQKLQRALELVEEVLLDGEIDRGADTQLRDVVWVLEDVIGGIR